MKSLEIKIVLFCELFQNRFYFKNGKHELTSRSVRKFWNFWFYCIVNMKNNYHQSFVVVCLMTYIQLNSHYVFIIYLDYIKNMLKREIDKTKTIFRRQKKIKLKYINAPKIEYNKQMCQLILNARVFVKQEINST